MVFFGMRKGRFAYISFFIKDCHFIYKLYPCGLMAIVLVVLDGAADRANPELSGMTPLEYADMPNLRRFAKNASKGMMYSVGKGIAPESDAAIFSILGYKVSDYTGRGPLEAFGAGLDVGEKTLGVRCNFATIGHDRRIIDRRAGRISTRDAELLGEEISKVDLGIDGVSFEFKPTVGHRGACVFRSESRGFSHMVSNADLGYVKKGTISVAVGGELGKLPDVVPLDKSKEAEFTAYVLNTFISKVIEALSGSEVNERRRREGVYEANSLLMRDAGVGLPNVEGFNGRFGKKAAFIAEMAVEKGISRLIGMNPIEIPEIKERNVRYKVMADKVNSNIDAYDFVYVHIKGPDEPGHDGDAPLKAKILEEIDANFFGMLDMKGIRLCVTADHATPCTMKAHSDDPVPVMFTGVEAVHGEPEEFDEKIGDLGSLGIINGVELVDMIIK